MSSATLEINGISRRFGDVVALNKLEIKIEPGELVALLGPSGCGKTTALRIVAGLESTDSGSVLLRGADITKVSANHRNMGMVFQAYSLFPNLNAQENVAFGLQMRKVAKGNRLAKAGELLELVGLNTQSKRFPHQLSGGQQQRVALARALAVEPDVLLLDEPLSALDAQVRANLREEIRRLQLSLGTTTLFVTHDQEEAMSISDRVGVMNHGRLEQIASPDTLYNKPATTFVASFVGLMNRLPGILTNGKVEVLGQNLSALSSDLANGQVKALVRPERINVTQDQSTPNARVITRSFLGASSRIICEMHDGTIVQSLMTSHGSGMLNPGETVKLEIADLEVLIAHE